MDGWKMSFLLGFPIFRGYVKLRGVSHRIWNMDLSPWNVILCWTPTARRISAIRTLRPAFAPRSRRALGWKQWIPDSVGATSKPTNFQGGKNHEEFHPPAVWLHPTYHEPSMPSPFMGYAPTSPGGHIIRSFTPQLVGKMFAWMIIIL